MKSTFLFCTRLITFISEIPLLFLLIVSFYYTDKVKGLLGLWPLIVALIGFMIGAIPRLWPYQHEVNNRFVLDAPACDSTMPWVFLCTASGIFLLVAIEFFARKKINKE